MSDHHHVRFADVMNVLQHMRKFIWIQAEVVAAYPGILGTGVLTVSVFAKDIVLDPRDVGNVHARPQQLLRNALGLRENGMRLELLRARLADDQRAADLRVVAIDLRSELGGHRVARTELP